MPEVFPMTATSVTFSIRTAVRKVMPYMMEMREYFHARPETSGNEFDTCKTIFRELSLLGAEDIRIIAGTGVTALIRGALPGPTVLLRAKTDAVALDENNDLPYASLVSGVMHASGHDGLIANLLGLAKILTSHNDQLHGTVRLVFEPNTETGGCLDKMIDSGILSNPSVDYVLDMQLDGSLKGGYLGLATGPLFASRDDFRLAIHGKSGRPYVVSTDENAFTTAIKFMHEAVTQLDALPNNKASLSFSFDSNSGNLTVLPACINISGTLRTYDSQIRDNLLQKLHSLYPNGHLSVISRSDAGENDAQLCEQAYQIWAKYGTDRFTCLPMNPGFHSDDITRLTAKCPTLSVFAGINRDTPVYDGSPDFIWDTVMLKYTCEALATLVYYLPLYR